MNLELSHEQVMLRDAAADALSRLETIASARAALDGEPLLDLWPTVREAGWAGLLVAEEHGGAGLGVFDAMLVLEECGKRLTGAGLLGHLAATLALGRVAEADQGPSAEALKSLASGDRRAAMVHACPPIAEEGWTVEAQGMETRRGPLPHAERDGDVVRVTGAAGFQPDLAGADLLVVPAQTSEGELLVTFVEPGASGVSVEPVVRYDATRPLGHLTLDHAPAEPLGAGGEALEQAWDLAQALLAADALGVAGTTLEMAVAYAKDRHAFGRPIGSYQAIKQQLVEMLRLVEKTRSLCVYVGYAEDTAPDELGIAASSARFAADEAVGYATRTCIAVHGGIGATWEHDAPLYWRRAQLSRLLLGGPATAADRVGAGYMARARARLAA